MSNNPNIEWIVWSFLNEGNLDETKLLMPLNKKKPTKYFVNNSNDVFQENTRFEWIDKIMAVITLCPQHTFQVLTKRPERMKEYFSNTIKGHILPLPNLWLGTSVENQKQADKRIPYLLETPAKVRVLSCEPLLSDIDLGLTYCRCAVCRKVLPHTNEIKIKKCDCGAIDVFVLQERKDIDWVIVGGESGNNARPMHPDWVRSIRNQCQVANIPFFFKGWGSWVSESPSYLKGYLKEHDKKLTCFKVPNSGFFETNLDTFVYENDQTIPKVLLKVGEKQSGCLLDGKEYKEYPKC